MIDFYNLNNIQILDPGFALTDSDDGHADTVPVL